MLRVELDSDEAINSASGDIIRSVRASAELTQSQLADLVSVEHHALSSYEDGSSQPTVPVLLRILAVCGYSIVLTTEEEGDSHGSVR